jgi:hypothetical protein
MTPEQEKNWPAVEQALRDISKERLARRAARGTAGQPRIEARPMTRAVTVSGIDTRGDRLRGWAERIRTRRCQSPGSPRAKGLRSHHVRRSKENSPNISTALPK